jgi:hypothetical protein
MYTYESFVTDGILTLLRPVVYSFLLIAVAIFILVLPPKALQRFMNGFTIISISIISIIISGQVLFFDAIAGLSVASPVIFYIRKGES